MGPIEKNRGRNSLGSSFWSRGGTRPSCSPSQETANLRATSPEVYGSIGKSQILSICDFDSHQ
jgi:hypothetical protein